MTDKLENYEILSVLGPAVRKLQRRSDNKVMVCKEINCSHLSDAEHMNLISEINLHRELKHLNIVEYIDKIVNRDRKVIYVLMEYCVGGDLSHLILQCKQDGIHLKEDLMWRILYQVSQALVECHDRNKKNGQGSHRSVLHRNLKSTNVFLDEWNNIKIGDFGFEVLANRDVSVGKQISNVVQSISPEQINNSNYSEKSDVWALGCLLYELCSFVPPFSGENKAELALKVRSGHFRRIPLSYSNELQNIISAMLTVEDVLRPAIDLIVQHPRIIAIHHQKMGEQWESRRFTFNDTPNGGKCQAEAFKERLETVKRREQAVRAKELLLIDRQNDIEKREKKLILKERMVEERLARAEIYLKQCKSKTSSNCSSEDNVNDICRMKERKQSKVYVNEFYQSAPNLSKPNKLSELKCRMKHVHFDPSCDKENSAGTSFKHYSFHNNATEHWIDGPNVIQQYVTNHKKHGNTTNRNLRY
ncbi:NEK2 (predicted) [Pycnogonum litorale]